MLQCERNTKKLYLNRHVPGNYAIRGQFQENNTRGRDLTKIMMDCHDPIHSLNMCIYTFVMHMWNEIRIVINKLCIKKSK